MARVELYDAEKLSKNEWRELQGISRDAFKDILDRSDDEIDALVEWDDPDRYYDSHIDPNTEVGRRYNENQSYTHPKVAVAINGGKSIGFMYTAHNTSGPSEQVRLAKRLSIVKNYLWLREAAVKPGRQQEGIAKRLGHKVLADAMGLQPISAYIWPDEIPHLSTALGKLGFSSIDEQMVRIFGENSEPVRQATMRALSVSSVREKLTPTHK